VIVVALVDGIKEVPDPPNVPMGVLFLELNKPTVGFETCAVRTAERLFIYLDDTKEMLLAHRETYPIQSARLYGSPRQHSLGARRTMYRLESDSNEAPIGLLGTFHARVPSIDQRAKNMCRQVLPR